MGMDDCEAARPWAFMSMGWQEKRLEKYGIHSVPGRGWQAVSERWSMEMYKRAYVKVDLDRIGKNMKAIRSVLPEGTGSSAW